jgi:hypothetical protein
MERKKELGFLGVFLIVFSCCLINGWLNWLMVLSEDFWIVPVTSLVFALPITALIQSIRKRVKKRKAYLKEIEEIPDPDPPFLGEDD